MLKIATYTKEDLVEIFNTDRVDSIKRSLDRLGYRYISNGKRGKNLAITITETPDAFKMFCINQLGVPAQSDFELLKTFFYFFFCDEEFQNLPVSEMARVLEKEDEPISRQTISKWIEFLRKKNIICADNSEYVYFATVSYNGHVGSVEITKEEYLKAWKAYWNVRNSGLPYSQAFNAMCKVNGGTVFKKPSIVENGFYTELINDLIDILIEDVEFGQM